MKTMFRRPSLALALSPRRGPSDCRWRPRRRPPAFTLEQVLSAPFPSDLVGRAVRRRASPGSPTRGARATSGWPQPPDYEGTPVTAYPRGRRPGDRRGRASTPDGKSVVYVRGGGRQPRGRDSRTRPAIRPAPSRRSASRLERRRAGAIGDGHRSAVSPKGDGVALVREGKIWSAPLDGRRPTAVAGVPGARHARAACAGRRTARGSRSSATAATTPSSASTTRPAKAAPLARSRASTATASRPGRPTASASPSCASRRRATRQSSQPSARASRGRSASPTRPRARAATSSAPTRGAGSVFREVVARQPAPLGRRRPARLPLGDGRLDAPLLRPGGRRRAGAADARRRSRSSTSRWRPTGKPSSSTPTRTTSTAATSGASPSPGGEARGAHHGPRHRMGAGRRRRRRGGRLLRSRTRATGRRP